MSRGTYRNANALRVLGLGVVGYFVWRLVTPKNEREREYALEAGKWYEFRILAHPYGDYAEWESAATEALEASNVQNLQLDTSGPSDVMFTFQKKSPITAKLGPNAVLFPNDAPLATATLLWAKPSTVVPLGASTS